MLEICYSSVVPGFSFSKSTVLDFMDSMSEEGICNWKSTGPSGSWHGTNLGPCYFPKLLAAHRWFCRLFLPSTSCRSAKPTPKLRWFFHQRYQLHQYQSTSHQGLCRFRQRSCNFGQCGFCWSAYFRVFLVPVDSAVPEVIQDFEEDSSIT